VIALVFAQLAARWGQAVALLALSVAATVAAVGVPVYTATIDRTATANELAAADPSERLLSMPTLIGTADEEPPFLDNLATARAALTAFDPVTTVQIRVQGLRADAPPSESHRMVARDGFCGRVVFEAGRCPVGSREVALPAALAGQTDHRPGDELLLMPVISTERGFLPDGPEVALTLVGVFEARDPTDPYWLAALDPIGNRSLPAIFTNRGTVASIEHTQEVLFVDAVLPADRLTPDAIPELREQLARTRELITADDPAAQGFTTQLPRLLDRISGHREQARALLPIAAAPLLALCWFVVYLAVGHGVAARRHEVGVVALRGAKPRTRVAAVATEYLLPVLAGALLGFAIVGGLTLDAERLRSAGVAAAGTLAAAVLALRRELAAPVVQLLRRVPPRRRAATVAVEVLAAAVAALVVVELHGLDGELVGVMVAGPAAVMLAVALLAARAVPPGTHQAGPGAGGGGPGGPAGQRPGRPVGVGARLAGTGDGGALARPTAGGGAAAGGAGAGAGDAGVRGHQRRRGGGRSGRRGRAGVRRGPGALCRGR
jgi:putative ABC transport system permease protein